VSLTRPGAAARMSAIELPPGRDVVVMADSEAGRIVGARSQAALSFALIGSGAMRLAPGFDLVVDFDLASYLFRSADARGAVHWATPVALGVGLGLARAL
jgi:hypothetical protein